MSLQELAKTKDSTIQGVNQGDFDDIEIPRDDVLDVDLNVEDIDLGIQEEELEVSNMLTKANWY